jgi:hypothetical protein
MPGEAWAGPSSHIPPSPEVVIALFEWDEQALAMVTDIERLILPLDLDSQGQFISLTNAMEMQLESGDPAPDVVRLLGDAMIALAKARRLPKPTQAELRRRVSALNQRVRTTTAHAR